MKGQHSMFNNKLQASHRPHYSKNGKYSLENPELFNFSPNVIQSEEHKQRTNNFYPRLHNH